MNPIRIILISALLGLALTVLIAWATALFVAASPMVVQGLSIGDSHPWPAAAPSDWPPAKQLLLCERAAIRQQVWSRLGREEVMGLSKPGDEVWSWLRTTSGWPLKAMTFDFGEVSKINDNPVTRIRATSGAWTQGVHIPANKFFGLTLQQHRIPLRPLWPQFLINLFFWSLVSGLLLFGPGALKRHIRTRRGQCPRCGYHMVGLTRCPECGAESLASRSSTAPTGVSQT